MKKTMIGIAAAGLLLAGCSGSSEGAPAPTTGSVSAAPADESVLEWHRIAAEYEPKIKDSCMELADGILANVCLGMNKAHLDRLENEAKLQPSGPYRTELLDDIGNFQRVHRTYSSTEMWCDGGNIHDEDHCTAFGGIMDADAGRVRSALKQILDSRG